MMLMKQQQQVLPKMKQQDDCLFWMLARLSDGSSNAPTNSLLELMSVRLLLNEALKRRGFRAYVLVGSLATLFA